MPVLQHLEINDRQGIGLVRFLDRQLVAGTQLIAMWQDLFLVVDQEDWRNVILDLSLVDFVSSEGLGKLVALYKKLAARNSRLTLCGLCPEVREVFAVTNLDSLFAIQKTVAEALVACSEDRPEIALRFVGRGFSRLITPTTNCS